MGTSRVARCADHRLAPPTEVWRRRIRPLQDPLATDEGFPGASDGRCGQEGRRVSPRVTELDFVARMLYTDTQAGCSSPSFKESEDEMVVYRRTERLGLFGAYSPVSIAESPSEIVAIAGQFGTDAQGSLPEPYTVENQVAGAFANVGIALEAANLGFDDVLNFRTYIVGRENIPAFMAARERFFADAYPDGNFPPNTLLLVSGLVEERFKVEIEALAARTATS